MVAHRMRWLWSAGTTLVLFVCLLVLASAGKVKAQQGSPSLPVCPRTDPFGLVFPSPFLDDDQTLFWVYVDIRRTGVLRSTDNGHSWLEVSSYSVPRGEPRITQFDIAPIRSSFGLAVYGAVKEVVWEPDTFDFFGSEDSGSTWQEGSSPCSERDCYNYSLRAASRPGVLFQPRTYHPVGTGFPEGVARSVDHGTTWQQVWGQTPVAQVAISPNFDQDETLFGVLPYGAQISNTNFIISHDAGETWHPGGGGLCSYLLGSRLTISPGFVRDRTLLLSADQSSLFMSEDAGLTWRAIFPPGGPLCNTNTEYGLSYAAFSPDYPDDPTIYAATLQGLYASYDAGRSWILLVSNSSNDLIVRRAFSTRRSPTESKAGGGVRLAVEDSYRVFLPLAAVQGSGPPYKPHTLFMQAQITGSYNNSHYRSDDGGRTWQCMTPPSVRTRAYLPLLRIRS